MDFIRQDISLNARRTCALGPAVLNKHWAPMAADHSARGSMKTGVKPETVCELQDTNDHRQVERKWRLPISVGKLSALEGRSINLHMNVQPWTFVIVSRSHTWWSHARDSLTWRRLKCRWNTALVAHSHCVCARRQCPDAIIMRRAAPTADVTTTVCD